MSPLTLRRYRAERLLRQEFEGLRGRVIATVRGRLRSSGVSLDGSDLEACYAQAWQGLYTAVLEGKEIANPTGWLALVTFRRAIEEHRARGRVHRGGIDGAGIHNGAEGQEPDIYAAAAVDSGEERDFAAELDDRVRLRQLFEGLRGRLNAREQEAASLCYLQGMSRAEAAARMGVSDTGMRKLMEGRGPGRPGVAGKVGELVETIRAGGWCEEQGSLMRGLAYGILDPDGERYRLALMHRGECPACRAYVVSLRGLAAVLPAPALMPWALGLSAAAGAGAGAHASTGHAGAGVGAGGVGAGAGVGTAGAGGAAGGGWFLAGGGVGAKLAVGCLVAVSVGAGCVAFTVVPIVPRHAVHRRHVARANDAGGPGAKYALLSSSIAGAQTVPGATASARGSSSTRAGVSAALVPAAKASREFGPEQALAPGGSRAVASAGLKASTARAASATGSASAGFERVPATGSSAGGSAPVGTTASTGGQSATRSSAAGQSASPSSAQREFGLE
jgi:DNA-directed RNA polymerase specialized sigma24 family protein